MILPKILKMKIKELSVFLLLTFISVSVFAQNKPVPPPPPPPPPPEIPADAFWGDITVKKTSKHQLVNNTKLSMIPPQGFVPAVGMSGFSKGESAMIMVMEAPQNIDKSISDLMAENPDLTNKGIKVKERKQFKINGQKAAYIIGDNGIQCLHMMAFGTAENAVFLTGICLANEESTKIDIKNAFKTAFYEKDLKINPLADAKFSIDMEESGLKLENVIMGAVYIFSFKDTTQDKGGFIITQIPNDGTSLENIAEQIIAKLATKGIEYNKVVSKNKIIIDGNEALEQIIESRKTIMDPLFVTYIVTLKKGDLAFSIMVVGGESGEKMEAWYRKTVESFKVKN